MYYLGLMSGTSMDAIDVAIVSFDPKAQLVFYNEYPYEQAFKQRVRQVNEDTALAEVTALDHELGKRFAEAVNIALEHTGIQATEVNAIGSHGQTVFHQPEGQHPTSVQIGDPNVISHDTGITTVADFRRMDVATGGQGAPLASAFHEYQFKQENRNTVILNIGGMANITLLSSKPTIGFDTGPGNALLADWVQLNQKREYDKNGEWASTGGTNKTLLDLMLADPYFDLTPPKSTGREYFNLEWIHRYLNRLGTDITAEDVQSTLLDVSAISIARSISSTMENIDEIIACGGGAHNDQLMQRLKEQLKQTRLSTTADYGLSPDCIEAVTFAWLAKQRLDGVPANLPGVTGGRKAVLLGGVYNSGKS